MNVGRTILTALLLSIIVPLPASSLFLPTKSFESRIHYNNCHNERNTLSSRPVQCLNASNKNNAEHDPSIVIGKDYLITDSLDLTTNRPSLLSAVSNPRDILSLSLLSTGCLVSYLNIIGQYDSSYVTLELVSIGLGLLSVAVYMIQLRTKWYISSNIRRGVVDDAVVNAYAASYSLAVCWLALRTGSACPEWLTNLDLLCPTCAVGAFLFSLVAPLVTLLSVEKEEVRGGLVGGMVSLARGSSGEDIPPLPALSPTELLRARGLFAIGILGCVFAPDALSFALGGKEWWNRVSYLHPSQQTLESSTALFALYATEASMVSHRVGKLGVAPYRDIVPSFAVVCAVLAVVPCVCALHWLGNDISFFSFYRE